MSSEDQTRICRLCGEEKSLLSFHRDQKGRNGRSSRCSVCAYANTKKWVSENKDKVRNYFSQYGKTDKNKKYKCDWALRKAHGITITDYDRMSEEQDNLCAICLGEPKCRDGRFRVDHDHEHGNIRALLCNGCNTGIGSFREDTSLLEKAIEYLRRHE